MNTLEEKSQEYAEVAFAKALKVPWHEAKQAFADAYIAGATEALAGQWRKPKDELPKFGDRFILSYRTKFKGSWLTITEVEKRRDWYDPFTDKNKDILAWMPIPRTT